MTENIAVSFLIRCSAQLGKADLIRVLKTFIENGFFPRVNFNGRMRRVATARGIEVLLEENFSCDTQSRKIKCKGRFSATRTDYESLMFVDIVENSSSPSEIVGYFNLNLQDQAEMDRRISTVTNLIKKLLLNANAFFAVLDREEFIDQLRDRSDAPAVAWYTVLDTDHITCTAINALSRPSIWQLGEVEPGIWEIQLTNSLVASTPGTTRSLAARLNKQLSLGSNS